MRKNFTEKEYLQIKQLIKDGNTYVQIAKELNRSVCSINVFCRKKNIRSKYIKLITKSKPSKKLEIATYFLNHSQKETCEKFNITENNFKSIMTLFYRIDKFKNIRKDKRNHNKWSLNESIIFAKYSGLISRDSIAKKLNRGSFHSIKEHMKRIGTKSKYINGIPYSMLEYWGIDEKYKIRTKACSGARSGTFHQIIIPWVSLAIEIDKIPEEFKDAIRSMAKFQMYIHKSKNYISCQKKIKEIIANG